METNAGEKEARKENGNKRETKARKEIDETKCKEK
jgi:hypothetical protein